MSDAEKDKAKELAKADPAHPVKDILNFIWYLQLVALIVVVVLWLFGVW